MRSLRLWLGRSFCSNSSKWLSQYLNSGLHGPKPVPSQVPYSGTGRIKPISSGWRTKLPFQWSQGGDLPSCRGQPSWGGGAPWLSGCLPLGDNSPLTVPTEGSRSSSRARMYSGAKGLLCSKLGSKLFVPVVDSCLCSQPPRLTTLQPSREFQTYAQKSPTEVLFCSAN